MAAMEGGLQLLPLGTGGDEARPSHLRLKWPVMAEPMHAQQAARLRHGAGRLCSGSQSSWVFLVSGSQQLQQLQQR